MNQYKQVIIVNKELHMSSGKMSAQVSHASMAFLTRMIQKNTERRAVNSFKSYELKHGKKKVAVYVDQEMQKWAQEAFEKGEDYFYARPKNPEKPYGQLVLCEPEVEYETNMKIDKDLYEQWIQGIFTKVILSAKNESQMLKIVNSAKEAGMVEDEDFFCIRDACLTELTPDETGTRWTCIGFRPMNSEKIDLITHKLQLYKD